MRFQTILSAVTLVASTTSAFYTPVAARLEGRQGAVDEGGQAAQVQQDIEATKQSVSIAMGAVLAEIAAAIALGLLGGLKRDLEHQQDPATLLHELEQTVSRLQDELDEFSQMPLQVQPAQPVQP